MIFTHIVKKSSFNSPIHIIQVYRPILWVYFLRTSPELVWCSTYPCYATLGRWRRLVTLMVPLSLLRDLVQLRYVASSIYPVLLLWYRHILIVVSLLVECLERLKSTYIRRFNVLLIRCLRIRESWSVRKDSRCTLIDIANSIILRFRAVGVVIDESRIDRPVLCIGSNLNSLLFEYHSTLSLRSL